MFGRSVFGAGRVSGRWFSLLALSGGGREAMVGVGVMGLPVRCVG